MKIICIFFYLLLTGHSILIAQQNNNLQNLPLKTIDSLMLQYFNEGDLRQALPYAMRSVELSKELYGILDSNYLNSLTYLGGINWMLNNYEKAKYLFTESVEISRSIYGEKHLNYANALNNLGNIYEELGDMETAERLFISSTDILRETVGINHPDFAHSLNNLAGVYEHTERYEEAEKLYLQALSNTSYEKDYNYATILNNLAGVYEELKQYEKAEKLYNETLLLTEELFGKKNSSYGTVLNNLALLYSRMGDYEKAIHSMKIANEIAAVNLGLNSPDYLIGALNLGVMLFEVKKYSEAEKLLLQTYKSWQLCSFKDNVSFINTCSALSNLYRGLEQNEKSAAYALESIRLNIQDSSVHIIDELLCQKLLSIDFISNSGILSSLAQLFENSFSAYQKKGDIKSLQLACLISKTALNLCLRFKNEFSSDDVKFLFLKKTNQWAGVAGKCHFNLMKEQNTMQDISAFNQVFHFSEQNKSILLADALKAQKSRQFGDLPDSLVLVEHNLQTRYDLCKKQLIQEQDAGQKQQAIAEFNHVRREIDLFQEKLAKNFPKYYQSKYGNSILSVIELQKALDDQTLFLEYFITEQASYIFAIQAHHFQIFPIPVGKDSIEIHVKKLREALSNYNNLVKDEEKAKADYIFSACWLFDVLLKPALADSSIKKIVLVPDALLGHIPFETLLFEKPAENIPYSKYPYALCKFIMSYAYSASLWNENRQANHKKVAKKGLLALAADYHKKQQKTSTMTYLQQMRQALQPLPAAKEEVKILSKQFKGDFVYDNDCNEAFFKEKAIDYNIIHLAMHGLLDQKYPILSSLVFTYSQDSTEDDFLQAYEISQLKLNAQLVVLSACETGYGKFQQGEGVMSLARSFMYAGVPSLVVSMWQVNDVTTGLLMEHFYKNLARGMHKDEALQQAKLTYMATIQESSPLAAHPAFWGAFIQLGNNNPISIEVKSNRSFLLILIAIPAVLFLLAVLFFMRKKIFAKAAKS